VDRAVDATPALYVKLHLVQIFGGTVTFSQSIQTCFKKYATFSGYASRSEYWYFELFLVLCVLGASVVIPRLSLIVLLVFVLPQLAVAARRLRDAGLSPFFLFLGLLPFLGSIALLIMYCQPSKAGRSSMSTYQPDTTAAQFCPQCGKLRLPGQSFCQGCGKAF
jgi:uncharacterized membrane protein YhaH (DUF805 family)